MMGWLGALAALTVVVYPLFLIALMGGAPIGDTVKDGGLVLLLAMWVSFGLGAGVGKSAK
jgi:hypothetical protein